MQTVNLTLDLVNKVLAYLGERPFGEVYLLIGAIQREAQPQLPVEEPVEEPVEQTEEATE